MCCFCILFFFFKQKTAYELRISDWSSDVCSSDLFTGQVGANGQREALSPTDILSGGFGQGAGEAADTVSRYLIERAEQNQPAVQMPTGIEVENPFLDGSPVRNPHQRTTIHTRRASRPAPPHLPPPTLSTPLPPPQCPPPTPPPS